MIPEETVRQVVYHLGGRIFTVIFQKQNGEERTMNARRGVHKHLAGGRSTIREQDHLIGCFDIQKKAYRCFDDRRVLELRARGEIIR